MSTIQKNTINLEALLQAVNNLPSAGGSGDNAYGDLEMCTVACNIGGDSMGGPSCEFIAYSTVEEGALKTVLVDPCSWTNVGSGMAWNFSGSINCIVGTTVYLISSMMIYGMPPIVSDNIDITDFGSACLVPLVVNSGATGSISLGVFN